MIAGHHFRIGVYYKVTVTELEDPGYDPLNAQLSRTRRCTFKNPTGMGI